MIKTGWSTKKGKVDEETMETHPIFLLLGQPTGNTKKPRRIK
jgi:hypothetical protein